MLRGLGLWVEGFRGVGVEGFRVFRAEGVGASGRCVEMSTPLMKQIYLSNSHRVSPLRPPYNPYQPESPRHQAPNLKFHVVHFPNPLNPDGVLLESS